MIKKVFEFKFTNQAEFILESLKKLEELENKDLIKEYHSLNNTSCIQIEDRNDTMYLYEYIGKNQIFGRLERG